VTVTFNWLVSVFIYCFININIRMWIALFFRYWVWFKTWVFFTVPNAIIKHTFSALMGLKSWLIPSVLRCLVRSFIKIYFFMIDWLAWHLWNMIQLFVTRFDSSGLANLWGHTVSLFSLQETFLFILALERHQTKDSLWLCRPQIAQK